MSPVINVLVVKTVQGPHRVKDGKEIKEALISEWSSCFNQV